MSEKPQNNILKELTILYIEDEDNIRKNIVKTLELIVKKVFSFENPLDALQCFEENNIDIVLSDINLPQITGLELCQKIRQKDTSLPIILLTAHLDTPYLLEATKLKLVDYLIKPVNFDALHKALKKASDEIIEQARYSLTFANDSSYNIQKKLFLNPSQEEVHLTASEITLLEYMIAHQNRVVSAQEIKLAVWQDSFEASDSALKNLLNKLRKKISKEVIINISGVGYRLQTKQ